MTEASSFTYQIEKRGDQFLVRGRHALDLARLALVIAEDDDFAREAVGLFPAQRRHPFCAGPHGASNVVDMDCIRRIFPGRPPG